MSNYIQFGHSILVAIPVALVPVPYYTQISSRHLGGQFHLTIYLKIKGFDLDYSVIMHNFHTRSELHSDSATFSTNFQYFQLFDTDNYHSDPKIYYSTDLVTFSKLSFFQFLLIFILILLFH